ncbi:hypothetical protein D9611_009735 [Ephemerocybe angulata]|uniref:Uncharacterized protein n=1 Tax=Ephemerocybe angulata TaxID=980116 RepID=A0A8H5C656_9AGAR|nr:hypothetical protein D9611_009735 [Tulosesus angulatus]
MSIIPIASAASASPSAAACAAACLGREPHIQNPGQILQRQFRGIVWGKLLALKWMGELWTRSRTSYCAMVRIPEATFTVPGRLVERINPVVGVPPEEPSKIFHLLDSAFRTALLAGLLACLTLADLQSAPKVVPTPQFPYKEASGKSCFLCEDARSLDFVGRTQLRASTVSPLLRIHSTYRSRSQLRSSDVRASQNGDVRAKDRGASVDADAGACNEDFNNCGYPGRCGEREGQSHEESEYEDAVSEAYDKETGLKNRSASLSPSYSSGKFISGGSPHSTSSLPGSSDEYQGGWIGQIGLRLDGLDGSVWTGWTTSPHRYSLLCQFALSSLLTDSSSCSTTVSFAPASGVFRLFASAHDHPFATAI